MRLRLAVLSILFALVAQPSRATMLGMAAGKFALDGKPAFLLGISYYGGLGADGTTVRSDLDRARRDGFNWVRVWATWAAFGNDVSAVDQDGRAREPYLTRLADLVQECDRRGMVVDVTLSRGDGANDSPRLASMDAHRQAVRTLVGRLKRWRNWYLDLSNERNIGDARHTGMAELRVLRDVVKELDPARPVTASHGGDIDKDEMRAYLFDAKLDFVTPHRPRGAQSASETAAKTAEYLAWMRELGRVVPVHYQEPFRRGYGDWEPTAADFARDLAGARAGGAAGWCFHNGSTRGNATGRPRRSFDLRDGPLFSQLDAEEAAFVAGLATARKAGPSSRSGSPWRRPAG